MAMRLFFLLLLLSSPSVSIAEQNSVDFLSVYQQIHQKGEALVAAYEPSNGAATGDEFSSLYFDIFEESGMELAIGLKDPNLKTKLESMFSTVIGLAMREAEKSKLTAAWLILDTALKEVATDQQPSESSFWGTLVQSFLILLREGFEAILVITALIAYLKRTGAEDKLKVIYQGISLALVASVLTAYLFSAVLKLSGEAQEALEGVTMLIAAGVLFYVSCWLFAKREADRWQKYVEKKIDSAISGGKLFALGFAAFLAVYREGAETVLFYQALVADGSNDYSALMIGGALAVVALLFLYWSMRAASFKLPMRLFFSVTAGLIYFLSVVFAGKGVLELQEARWISITPLEWLPRVEFLGLFPTLETVVAQLILILPIVISAIWLKSKSLQQIATDK